MGLDVELDRHGLFAGRDMEATDEVHTLPYGVSPGLGGILESIGCLFGDVTVPWVWVRGARYKNVATGFPDDFKGKSTISKLEETLIRRSNNVEDRKENDPQISQRDADFGKRSQLTGTRMISLFNLRESAQSADEPGQVLSTSPGSHYCATPSWWTMLKTERCVVTTLTEWQESLVLIGKRPLRLGETEDS